MGRYIEAKCRVCRRLGEKLFLKGARCETTKCAMEKREKVPGQHGDRRVRYTDFGLHMREVQRAKKMYGVFDRQFTRYFREASRSPGNTGEYFLTLLERRLDNIIYRLGFASSRSHARQLITHKHITVNNKRVTSPSFWGNVGDVVKPANNEVSRKIVTEALKSTTKPELPSWLKLKEDTLEGTVVQLPTRAEIQVPINEQLIVEYMSI